MGHKARRNRSVKMYDQLAANVVREIAAQRQEKNQEIDELLDRVAKARELLRRCDVGFGAFIMGRRMARKERDKLRDDIQRWLDGRA